MQSNEHSPDIEALLRGYGQPVADQGFTQAVMARLDKEARIRRILIGLAALLGGVILLVQMRASNSFEAALMGKPWLVRAFDFSALNMEGLMTWLPNAFTGSSSMLGLILLAGWGCYRLIDRLA